jgi:hypothetical protein
MNVKNLSLLVCEKNFKIFLAIALAMGRDGSSGGLIRLAIIKKDSLVKETVSGKDLPTFYEEL